MPTPTPRIAVLGNRVPSLNIPELEHFADLGSLLAAPAFDVVLLDLPAVYSGRVLRKLRTLHPYRYSLIYCCRDQNGWCEALGDGACPVESSEIRTLWGCGKNATGCSNGVLPPSVLKVGCFHGCGCATTPRSLPFETRRCLNIIAIRCWMPSLITSRSTRLSGSV